MESQSKVEIVRVSSTENLNECDVQLRAAYSHIRIASYCQIQSPNKPPNQKKKFKKLLMKPKLSLAAKSCDNIYSINRNSSTLKIKKDSKQKQMHNSMDPVFKEHQGFLSLDWRSGRKKINSEWQNTSRSAEYLLSRSPKQNCKTATQTATAASPKSVTTPNSTTTTTKSKIVSLLRAISPRLIKTGYKQSLPTSPMIYPWIRVEYSSDSIDNINKDGSPEIDMSFQEELHLSKLRKLKLSASPSSSSSTYQNCNFDPINCNNEQTDENENVETSTKYNQTVHEDRKKEDHRGIGGEVAVLEKDNRKEPSSSPSRSLVLGGGGGGGDGSGSKASNRRTRPLSLAVQPLNYHRIDPDINHHRSSIKHLNMTSQESIGSCSLDVDRSTSDRSENTVGSLSEKTLHSLNLSNSEDNTKIYSENQINGNSIKINKENLETDNINRDEEELIVKKPSYLGLACSVSGYSGITRYDSKLREGFRSRDSSPGSRLITRETSPAGFRSNENLGINYYPVKSQSISPLATNMDLKNGFNNGKDCKIETFIESKSPLNVRQDYSEVDKGILNSSFGDISPIRGTNVTIKNYIQVTSISNNNKCHQQLKSYGYSNNTFSSPKLLSKNNCNDLTSNNENNGLFNDSLSTSTDIDKDNKLNDLSLSINNENSIQQRVERLYGRGALAQSFFYKRSSANNSISSDNSFNKSRDDNLTNEKNNFGGNFSGNGNNEESLKKLPVLRHLKPEFRAQLPVVSPKRPTDNSEILIKPLQRLSLSSRKNETITSNSIQENNHSFNNKYQLNIPDQQPAAPEVVLPVIDHATASNNLIEQSNVIKSCNNSLKEKDGYHFINLLSLERERLISLAAGAESELESGNPLPEEAAGKLRSAAGKARLLATQKMQQFEGLCHKNINKIPGEEFPTTNEDLEGFWDMVMLQVVQVNSLFDHIDTLKKSNWQEVSLQKPSADQNVNNNIVKRKTIVKPKVKPTANSEANRKARELARKQMLEDKRKAMKSQAQNSVEIFTPKL